MNMGNNFGFPATALNFLGRDMNNVSSDLCDDISSSDSDSSSISEDIAVDSYIRTKHIQSTGTFLSDNRKFLTLPKITLETVNKIEMDLDFYEFISLIFLLYDNNYALQVLHTSILAGPKHFTKDKLSNWARTNPMNWPNKLVEALAVIQNFEILSKLGYSENDINQQFYPTKDVTLFLSRPKKMLYTVCECLPPNKARKLINLVHTDNKFENNISIQDCDPVYLEYHILFWISEKYITVDKDVNISNLVKHLKKMGFLNKADDLISMEISVNEERSKLQNISSNNYDECVYQIIDPNELGVCIIINMRQFTKNVEKRKQFQPLLPSDKLDDRRGSLEDVEILKQTCKTLKLRVFEEHDLRHDELDDKIQSLVKQHFKPTVHSVLFLCILSHGAEGIIYGVNSIPVPITDIENTIAEPTLEALLGNKPKVIIIQACQGTKPLYAHPERKRILTDNVGVDGQLQLDGPVKSVRPHADMLTCMAIIEGYVAVRSCKSGTIYIQELCRCLMKYHKEEHFQDIVTRVHYKLNNRDLHVPVPKEQSRCDEHENCLCMYMTPKKAHDTFCKKLYLIPRQ